MHEPTTTVITNPPRHLPLRLTTPGSIHWPAPMNVTWCARSTAIRPQGDHSSETAAPRTAAPPTPACLTRCDNDFFSINQCYYRHGQQYHPQPPSTHRHQRCRPPNGHSASPAPSPPRTGKYQRRRDSTSDPIDCSDVSTITALTTDRGRSSRTYTTSIELNVSMAMTSGLSGTSTRRRSLTPQPALPLELTRDHLTYRPPSAKPRTPPSERLSLARPLLP